MAAATTAPSPEPSVPDFLADPNAVLNDFTAAWRYGKAPDYSKTRTYFEQSKCVFLALVAASDALARDVSSISDPMIGWPGDYFSSHISYEQRVWIFVRIP